MKVYIAAPIFTPHQLAVVEAIKEMAENTGFDVFSPYHASREIWKGRKPADCEQWERDAVLRGNVENINDADALVAWLQREDSGYEGRTDTGVAWEMGYANALGTVYTLGYIHPHDPLPEKGLNLMLTGTMDALTTDIYQLRDCLEVIQGEGLADVHKIFDEKYPTNRILERD